VVSDSHGNVFAVKKAISLMGNVDAIIHLGDCCRDAVAVSKELKRDIIYVRGNCDFSSGVDYDKVMELGGKRVFVTHGHHYDVKSDYMDLYFKAVQEEVDLVLFGHTHFAEAFDKDNIVFMNPGSVSRSRGSSETYGIIIIEKGLIIPNIFEL
jgi:putative phosphoesterase